MASFLNEGGDDEDEDDAPVKSSKSKLADKRRKTERNIRVISKISRYIPKQGVGYKLYPTLFI